MRASSQNQHHFGPIVGPKTSNVPCPGSPTFPSRTCIGNNFALMETAVLLAVVAQRFEISMMQGAKVEPLASITLRPANGVWVSLKKR
jgi:hypothetical protein